MKELYQEAPQAFHEMRAVRGRGRPLWQPKGLWLPMRALRGSHTCAEFRLEKMKHSQKRMSRSGKR